MNEVISAVRVLMGNAYHIYKDRGYVDPDTFDKLVNHNEFVKLGHGCFSFVYKHVKTNLAVKITGFQTDGVDAFPDYVDFIRKNPSLKHLPKIHHFETLNDENKCFFAILPVYEKCKLNLDEIYRIEDVIEDGKPRELPSRWNETLNETCIALNSTVYKHWRTDLYYDNMMTGEDDEPILTDPFAFKKAA